MRNQRFRGGFTIIEMMVAFTIMAVFSGLVMAYYYNFTQERNLDSEAKRLVDILDLAKRKTAAGDSSMCVPSSSSTVESFRVERTGNSTYRLYPNCKTGTAQPVTYTISASSNVTLLTAGGDTSVTFYHIDPSTGANPGCFKLRNDIISDSTKKCRYVQVNSGGVITEERAGSCSGCP